MTSPGVKKFKKFPTDFAEIFSEGVELTRAPLGCSYNTTHWGGGLLCPPLLSPKLVGRFSNFKRQSKARQNSHGVILGLFCVRAKMRSPEVTKGQIWAIWTFPDKSGCSSETRRARRSRKKAFDSSFQALSLRCRQI